MLVFFITWVIISFILYTFGDMLLTVYNKVCKQNEEYNFIDKLLLGLCLLIIPLSINSLYLPSNHWFLAVTVFVCINYWGFHYQRVFIFYLSFKEFIRKFTNSYKSVLLVISILVFTLFFTWHHDVYDAAYYHLQNIKWNEEYSVVPGLANIDDRFGFNSNIFLLNAIVTFRFILGEAIYPLQPLFITAITCWIVYELLKSGYEIKRTVILSSYILLYWVSIYFLGGTSTDILPNFIVFYIIARIILYPELLDKKYLLGIVLPVLLITFKLSFFPIGLISLYLIYRLIKNKNNKAILFMLTISLLIVIPWLIRNIIISGYLIYPLYQIDLFDVDWKVSQEVAIKEKDYIFTIGYYFFRIALRYPWMSVRDPLFINILTAITLVFTFVSSVIISYNLFKKKKSIDKHIYLLCAIFLLSIIVWAAGGPDARFISGILSSIIFLGGIMLFQNTKHNTTQIGKYLFILFTLSIVCWTGYRYYNFHTETEVKGTEIFSHILLKPYSVSDRQKAKNIDVAESFYPYPINNGLFIWAGPIPPYEMPVPACIHSDYTKFLPIECIEARGFTIQEGFRSKENCK